jgi:hypothetical protein
MSEAQAVSILIPPCHISFMSAEKDKVFETL